MLELLAAIAKLALYAGSFAGAGVAFACVSLGGRLGQTSAATPRLIAMAAAIMLAAAIAGAAILIARLGGQVDSATLSAIWDTPAGPAIALQLGGAMLLLLSSRFCHRRPFLILINHRGFQRRKHNVLLHQNQKMVA